VQISCHYMEFIIISDRKVISSQLLLSLSVLGSIFNHFLNSNNFVYIRTGRFFSRCLDCTFKSTRKLNREISYSLDKSKMPGHCGFLLGNPQSASIVDCVPTSNLHNDLIILCICLANLKSVSLFTRESKKSYWPRSH
jgi:hypothetical protein